MFGIKYTIKKYIEDNQIRKDPVKYARKIGVNIGENSRIIEWPDWGGDPYLVSIGNHVTISYGCAFITHDGSTWIFREQEKYKSVIKVGKIDIGNNCFIGARTTIMPGVTIGDNCVIGACSLVNKNVPSGEVWAGNPAKFICKSDDYAEKCLKNNPVYDRNNLKNNRKQELIRIVNSANKNNGN